MPVPPRGWTWDGLMTHAMEAAREAGRGGDVPVGAVVAAPSGEILACCGNRVERDGDPAGHAEILALREACRRHGSAQLPGKLLIVTLEPCLMCAGAIALARIAGVVFGAWDARAGALSSCADRADLPLGGRAYWHMGGVLAAPCAKLLRQFFHECRQAP